MWSLKPQFVMLNFHGHILGTPVNRDWSGNYLKLGRVCLVANFFTVGTWGIQRVGPHLYEFMQLAVAAMLGKGVMRRCRLSNVLVKVTPGPYNDLLPLYSYDLKISINYVNKDYAFSVCKFLYDNGYVVRELPEIGGLRKLSFDEFAYAKTSFFWFNTFRFTSLDWLDNLFYVDGKMAKINVRAKFIKPELEKYLGPLALAHWVSGSGTRVVNLGLTIDLLQVPVSELKHGAPFKLEKVMGGELSKLPTGLKGGLQLATGDFSKEDNMLLADILKRLYGLKCLVYNVGKGQYNLFIYAESMPKLRTVIEPYLHPSIYNKVRP